MAVARVQNQQNYGNPTSVTPFASGNTAGNVLACGVFAGTLTTPVVTDSNSNTWVFAGTQLATNDSGHRNLYLFYALNCAAGANSVTVATDGADAIVSIAEYSGLPTTLTPQFSSATGIGTSYDAGALVVGSAAAFFGIVSGQYGGVTNTPANGFTDIPSNVAQYWADDLITSGGGTTDYAGTITNAGNNGWNAAVIAFPSAPPGHVISGSAGLAGATVTLSGDASASTTADGSGNYSFASLADGNYVVTPSSDEDTFSPTSRSETVSGADITGVNFTASLTPWNISGSVGVGGVTVTLSGAASASVTSASNGSYSFTGLADGSYVVTPTLTNYTFSPASANETVNDASIAGVNFTGTAVPTKGTPPIVGTFGFGSNISSSGPPVMGGPRGTRIL